MEHYVLLLKERYGENHPKMIAGSIHWGTLLFDKSEFAEADKALREAEIIFCKLLSPANLWLGDNLRNQAISLYNQGLSLAKSGQTNEGERLLHEAFELRTKSLPKEHFWVAIAESALGEGLMMQKKYAEAEPFFN